MIAAWRCPRGGPAVRGRDSDFETDRHGRDRTGRGYRNPVDREKVSAEGLETPDGYDDPAPLTAVLSGEGTVPCGRGRRRSGGRDRSGASHHACERPP